MGECVDGPGGSQAKSTRRDRALVAGTASGQAHRPAISGVSLAGRRSVWIRPSLRTRYAALLYSSMATAMRSVRIDPPTGAHIWQPAKCGRASVEAYPPMWGQRLIALPTALLRSSFSRNPRAVACGVGVGVLACGWWKNLSRARVASHRVGNPSKYCNSHVCACALDSSATWPAGSQIDRWKQFPAPCAPEGDSRDSASHG